MKLSNFKNAFLFPNSLLLSQRTNYIGRKEEQRIVHMGLCKKNFTEMLEGAT